MKDEATPEMIEMAKGIARKLYPEMGDFLERAAAYHAALVAIIETQRRDADEAYRACAETRHVTLGDRVRDTIRAGHHYGKESR